MNVEWTLHSLPPGVLMLLGAVIVPLLPKAVRAKAFLLFPLGALALLWTLPDGVHASFAWLHYTLEPVRADALSRIFGVIFAFIAFAGGIYALHIDDRRQQSAALAYAGGSLGVTFAGDWITFYFFWELMAVASTVLIWARGTKASDSAGLRYIVFHIVGGALLLGGIALHVGATGSLAVAPLADDGGIGNWILLAGVGLNAAMLPLHAWLPDSYPKATVTGAAFLSAFTTKTAVYALARVFPGWEILVVLGVAMTLFGVVYAFLQNDLRGIFSYHIISQVGYMVTGIGIGTQLALNGAVAHAFSHILYKALLFMAGGAVLQATGTTRLTDLAGAMRRMPAVFWLYLVGAVSISGVPFFNGFISKSMVVSGALYDQRYPVMWLLQLAAVGTFLSIGLKVPFITWFRENLTGGVQVARLPANMTAAMGLLAALCLLFGVYPDLLYRYLPFDAAYEPYTVAHLVESVQLLGMTFVAFFALRALSVPSVGVVLDVDWVYRRSARLLRAVFLEGPGRLFQGTEHLVLSLARALSERARHPAPWLLSLAAGRPITRREAYSPDRSRPQSAYLVGSLLFFFALLAGLALL